MIWEFDSTLRGWYAPGETCTLYKKECPESNLRSDGDTSGIQTYKCDSQGKKASIIYSIRGYLQRTALTPSSPSRKVASGGRFAVRSDRFRRC